MATIVGVHGMAQHRKSRDQLLPLWSRALADGVHRAVGRPVPAPEMSIAFYGDLYLPATPPATSKSAGKGIPLGDVAEDEWPEIAAGLAELVSEQEIADAAERPDMGYTRVPVPVQALMRAIDRRFGAASAILTVGVFRQVRRFLREPVYKEAINDRVAAAVGSDCRVLIGHSLGSVVAYEHLRTRTDHQVRLLLTAGSPLALRMVRSWLPEGALDVSRWVNLRDRRDPVACAGALRRWWPQIAEIDEMVVDNRNDTHAAERYLGHAQTGDVLVAELPHLAAG